MLYRFFFCVGCLWLCVWDEIQKMKILWLKKNVWFTFLLFKMYGTRLVKRRNRDSTRNESQDSQIIQFPLANKV